MPAVWWGEEHQHSFSPGLGTSEHPWPGIETDRREQHGALGVPMPVTYRDNTQVFKAVMQKGEGERGWEGSKICGDSSS